MSASFRPRIPTPPRRRGPARRGAASLIVVMVLFFVISLVAAYTSRNLVFEQRTSANQYRATLAFEAADAGVEWALARLSEGRMNDDCTQLANAAAVNVGTPEPSFRLRYLPNIDTGTGVITPAAGLLAGCVFDGSAWSCDCPAAGEPAPAFTANGDGPYVAFWLRFSAIPGRAGVVRVDVNGCTRNDPACLRFTREAQSGDGLAAVSAVLALRNALATAPTAALTVRGTATVPSGTTLTATNAEPAANGITVHSGATLVSGGSVTLRSLPGTPAALSVIENDPALALPDLSPALVPATPANNGVDRMFASVFGMWQSTYVEQPGVVLVNCASGCSASDINDAMLLHPGHAVYAQGAGPLTVGANIGSASNPVVLVADGNVEFSGAATIFGVVYSRAALWTTAGTGTIQGAAIAQGNLQIGGTQTIDYDGTILTRLRMTSGSFVKVPGGWRDFAP